GSVHLHLPLSLRREKAVRLPPRPKAGLLASGPGARGGRTDARGPMAPPAFPRCCTSGVATAGGPVRSRPSGPPGYSGETAPASHRLPSFGPTWAPRGGELVPPAPVRRPAPSAGALQEPRGGVERVQVRRKLSNE